MSSTPQGASPEPASQVSAPALPEVERPPRASATPSTAPLTIDERPPRWTDRVTFLLLFATAAVLFSAALPAVLRLSGIGPQVPPVMRAERLPLLDRDTRRRPLPAPPRRSLFAPEEDQEELEPPSWGRPQDADRDTDSPLTMALARRRFRLFADPSSDATTVGTAEAGDQLMVMKSVGDWVMVLRSSAEGVVMGWTRRSDVAIR
ncbi:hypothetical protein [Chondromyces crocatus]|nr:hypothetical protein [Chondromyces crocatus]